MASNPDSIAIALGNALQVVVDASLILDTIIGEPARLARALRFFDVCNSGGTRVIVPPTFASEVDSAICQSVLRGAVPAAQKPAIFAALDTVLVETALDPIELDAVRLGARRIADELQQPGVYDATYAALAEKRNCQFWTADKRFANAARQIRRRPDGSSAPAFPFVQFIGDH